MKKIVTFVLSCVFIVSFAAVYPALALRQAPPEYFKGRYDTKVYVEKVVNSSEDSNINTDALRSAIEKAFSDRISTTFQVVQDEQEAEIIVSVDVKEFVWMDRDPVDMFPLGATIADAIKQEHYARMRVDVKVTIAETNRVLWEDKVKATITSPDLGEEESYNLINERLAQMILKEMFRKTKRRNIL